MAVRKRIALLLGEAEENYQSLFIEGFFKQAFEYNYDVCVFSMYQKFQESTAREIGESTIFTLINYELFDGVVILKDTLQTPDLAEQVEAKIKASFNGPVFCIDKESQNFPTIMTDHYSVVKKQIAHLIDVHGYRDIAYLTGKEWHIHSKERLQAYVDCMKEYNLPVRENRIFYGDFWYTSGETMVEKLLKNKEDMPRAIACANDCMAIGVAKALEENGYKIPKDVAVIGYDALEVGRTSPVPITSAPIPAKECGIHAIICLKAAFDNEPIPAFKADVDLFIGSSCGCHNESIVPKVMLRDGWETDLSSASYYSCYNHMMEDLLAKTDFEDLMNTIFSYVYQLEKYDSFHICLNSHWAQPQNLSKMDSQCQGYTEKILHVLQCDKAINDKNGISYDDLFDREILLPELHEEHEEPKAYFFTPLHFEDRCLGYAVISYGKETRCYDETYRLWIRSVMQGLECFRRLEALQQSNHLLQSTQIRDSLTGLYNYKGLLQQIQQHIDQQMSVVAIDIKQLSVINDKYGREEGNRAIQTVGNILSNCVEDGLSCRLGNGEFIGVSFDGQTSDKAISTLKNRLLEQLDNVEGFLYDLSVYVGYEADYISSKEEFERLVNTTVAQKNGNKINERKMQETVALTEEELKEVSVVQEILDDNHFLYHFQPIVNAQNGEIYAYEALMRADVTPFLSPLKILKYAEYLERLYDVEKYTFFNVLDTVCANKQLFEGKKVFINSIPGQRLQGDDAVTLENKLKEYSNSVVVELTEQAELSDDELAAMKSFYEKLGIETAVDDYGTGYSNVTNLLRYMPNCVKIDRMLLSKIHESSQKQHFVREVVEFAHDNNIKALAEGVETAEELQMVIHLGVDLIQGYYTAKPAKEIVPEIATDIQEEIKRYHQQEMAGKGRKVYVAGKEGRISLAKVVADKYVSIEVVNDKTTYRDVTIAGVPGILTNLSLDIKDGYKGRIVLDNASFSGKRKRASIVIGKSCEVTLVLQGDNHLFDGGIEVPEGSKLIVEGEGNLEINVDSDSYFGIGNNMDSRHGMLEFDQDGCIDIYTSGVAGVGIGSGLGGDVHIRRGKYIINMSGNDSVGIGSINGDVDLQIEMCNINMNFSTIKCVAIGSLTGNVKARVSHFILKGILGGDHCVGIGCAEDGDVEVSVDNGTLNMNLRSKYVLNAIGSTNGETTIDIRHVALLLKCDGEDAVALGNKKRNAKIVLCKAMADIRVNSQLDYDLGAQDEDVHIIDTPYTMFLNGVQIQRQIEDM